MLIEQIDNFLDKDDLNKLISLPLNRVSKNEIKVYHNSIIGKKILQSDCIPDNFLVNLNLKYHHRALEILKKINEKKVDLYDYSEFHIIETGSDCNFPIHDDTPNKLLSGVIYLKPENNIGTNFYDTKTGQNKKTIEWKKFV